MQVDAESSTWSPAARCVDITPGLSSCRRLGYRQMRLPNLLNDTTASSLNSTTMVDECDDGEDGLVLMCSLLAPVCIDRPIWPCASLCHNVTAATAGTCRQLLAGVVDCDRLPSDDQLCIAARPNSSTDTNDDDLSHAAARALLHARLRQRRKKPR